MKKMLFRPFIKGATVVLPLLVTAWLLWSVLMWLNTLGVNTLAFLGIPSLFPGMGLGLMLLGLLTVGLMFQFNPVSWLYQYFEDALMRFPVVKTLYGAIKDFAGMFDQQKNTQQQVVLVKIGDLGQAVGFITSQQLPKKLTCNSANEDLVAVYMPMSYMVGGYTLLVSRERLTPVDWSFEDAMRFALTAGVSQARP